MEEMDNFKKKFLIEKCCIRLIPIVIFQSAKEKFTNNNFSKFSTR